MSDFIDIRQKKKKKKEAATMFLSAHEYSALATSHLSSMFVHLQVLMSQQI